MNNYFQDDKDPFEDLLFILFLAGVLIICLIGYSLVNNDKEPVNDKRQQIVTIKNNGQEIVYYVDGNRVKLGYEDKE